MKSTFVIEAFYRHLLIEDSRLCVLTIFPCTCRFKNRLERLILEHFAGAYYISSAVTARFSNASGLAFLTGEGQPEFRKCANIGSLIA